MIHFVYGGLYQGQEEYLAAHYSPVKDHETLLFPAEEVLEDWSLEKLSSFLEAHDGDVIVAGREIGMGVVPADPQLRAYRDHIGRCYQLLFQKADRITHCFCGLYRELTP